MNAAARARGRPRPGTFVVGAELVVAAVGLTLVVLGPWRLGIGLVGAALMAGAVARILLPERHAGLLRVRRTPVDVVIMTTLGIMVVVLAFLVPGRPGR